MVIVKLTGGMGNQLFQYAMGRALASRYDVPLKLDRYFLAHQRPNQPFARRTYALDLFSIKAERASIAEVSQYVPLVAYQPRFRLAHYGQRLVQRVGQVMNPRYITEKNADAYDPAVLANAPAHCYIDGYWQSEKYIAAIEDALRTELSFARPMPDCARQIVAKIDACEAVCVHIRRTDFLTDSRQTTLTLAHIDRGVAYLLNRGITPTLFVFSDDMPWCRQRVRVGELPIHFVDETMGDAGTQFQLMTHCRHFIISVSTFGWWAAWLATHPEKLVLHPRHPRSADWAADDWIALDSVPFTTH